MAIGLRFMTSKRYKLYKLMRQTITVDQYNIALTLADYGEIPIEHEAALLSKFVAPTALLSKFVALKEALEKDAAYLAAPSLKGLLTVTQLVMNSWEKDAFRSQGSDRCHQPRT